MERIEPARVLVVDDEVEIRRFVTRVLNRAGYVTHDVASGADGLQLMANGIRFDLVVTDVRMPAMSGPAFVQQVCQTERSMKVLYLTGYNDQLFHEKRALWEDEAFLDKPCTVAGLLEATSLLLSGSTGGGAVSPGAARE